MEIYARTLWNKEKERGRRAEEPQQEHALEALGDIYLPRLQLLEDLRTWTEAQTGSSPQSLLCI